MIIEPRKDSAVRIIDVGHQDTLRATPFQPIGVRSIELDQFPPVRLPRPPSPMRTCPPPKMVHALRQEPGAQRLDTDVELVPLGQLLHREGRPKITIPLPIQLQRLRLLLLGNPPVRRLPPPSMHQPLVALLLHPSNEPPHLSWSQSQQRSGMHLRQLLVYHLTDHMDPSQLLGIHRDPVLSDHSALLVKADRRALKRTFLSW
jgi:hypothetical protein